MTTIKYADDEDKKARMLSVITKHPGINSHKLYVVFGGSSRVYIKLIKDMVNEGVITSRPGEHNAILFYVKPRKGDGKDGKGNGRLASL